MYRLSNSFPYLLARLGIRMGSLFEDVVKQEGLTLQMYRIIAAISEEERPLKLVELAALTSADISTLSRVVAAMAKKGILSRERPENDQRSLQVTLTPEGERLLARYAPVAAYYETIATSSLSAEAAEELKTTLVQLYANLDRLESEVRDGTIHTMIAAAGDKQGEPQAKAKRRTKETRTPSQ